MSLLAKEWEARIELIQSIARSQQAIARILDSVADISGHLPAAAKSIGENVRSLTAMQLTMAETVAGVRLRRTRFGRPAKPWLHASLQMRGRIESAQRKLPDDGREAEE